MSLPMIFHTADLPFDDRKCVYDDILGSCKPDEVSDRIVKYVAQNVEASGWQAVWRSTPKASGHHQPFDLLVQVITATSSGYVSTKTGIFTVTTGLL